MRVEIFGPSGVGKSTLVEAAAARRGPAAHWLAPSEVNERIGRPVDAAIRAALDEPAVRDIAALGLSLLSVAALPLSKRYQMVDILRRSIWTHQAVSALDEADPLVPVVHDELLVHRSMSLFPAWTGSEDEVTRWFSAVPLPDAAVGCVAEPGTIVERVRARDRRVNVYLGLDDEQLLEVVARADAYTRTGLEILAARGARVHLLHTDGDVAAAADELHRFITGLGAGRGEHPVTSTPADPGASSTDDSTREQLLADLLAASGSFRKGTGRYVPRTPDVYYCAFSTPRISADRTRSQRDAARRLERYGLDAATIGGRSVLDLGCNAGAMLLQASNLGPARGLGIEYDADKVAIAQRIADFAGLDTITFRQGDIDALDASIGTFDVVFAFAIEAHVTDRDHLFRLLGEVTGDLLCFEGNSGADMDAVKAALSAAGFASFEDLGPCDDDVRPENNRRPMLLARKAPARRSLLDRLRGRR